MAVGIAFIEGNVRQLVFKERERALFRSDSEMLLLFVTSTVIALIWQMERAALMAANMFRIVV